MELASKYPQQIIIKDFAKNSTCAMWLSANTALKETKVKIIKKTKSVYIIELLNELVMTFLLSKAEMAKARKIQAT